MSVRVLQPVAWCGLQKGGPDSPMVCGSCPDWQMCDADNRCARATDEDYTRGLSVSDWTELLREAARDIPSPAPSGGLRAYCEACGRMTAPMTPCERLPGCVDRFFAG